jgi:cytidine deaminase
MKASLGESDEVLVQAAASARSLAYAPYSGFLVGAAVRTKDGRVFSGCNVENASYGATLCAERVAIAKMISEGAREPVVLAVYTEGERLAMPCGLCRQVLVEFSEDLLIIAAGPGKFDTTTLAELHPQPFVFHRE